MTVKNVNVILKIIAAWARIKKYLLLTARGGRLYD